MILTIENLLKNTCTLEQLKDEDKTNLERLLKNAQSKKCRSKAMNRLEDLNKSIEIIDAIQEQLNKFKVVKTIDINNLSLIDINKAIKNAQSKKCLAKAMNRMAIYEECIVEENRLLVVKDSIGKQPKVNKIQLKINELLELKQTKAIKEQIQLLQSLL